MQEYSVIVSKHKGNPVDQLQCYLNEFKNQTLSWTSDIKEFRICISHIVITPAVMALVIELLSHQLPQVCDRHNAEPEAKWIAVKLDNCTLTASYPYPDRIVPDECCCTHEEVHQFFSIISRRTKVLILENSTEIMASWISSPRCDPITLAHLDLYQCTPLSSLQYSKLGEMIQKSPQLELLSLRLPFDEAPLLLDGLANALQLRFLSLFDPCRYNPDRSLSSPVVPAVVRLLQNPFSQLQQLCLEDWIMDDCQVARMARALPTSQLRELYVHHKTTQFRGLLEFAHQLPRIQHLTSVFFKVDFGNRPNETEIDYVECGNAWVQGLMWNFSIKYTDLIYLFEGLHSICSHGTLHQFELRWKTNSRDVLPVAL